MPFTNPQQLTFDGGVNAKATPHTIGENEVATATNIDFGLEPGAASVRQGCTLQYRISTSPVTSLFKHYKNNLDQSVTYAQSGGYLWRVVGQVPVNISGATGYAEDTAITQYRDNIYAVGTAGSLSLKDDGNSTYHWIKTAPANALTVTVDTLTPLTVCSSFGSSSEGLLVVQAGGTGIWTTTGSTYRIEVLGSMATTNLATNGSSTIGDYGTDYTEIYFSAPSNVLKVSKDYSIGDATFNNYWHTELDLEATLGFADAQPDPEVLIESQLGLGTGTTTGVDLDSREEMLSEARTELRAPVTRFSAGANTFNVWAVPRPHWELVSKESSPQGWSNIGAVRIIVESDNAQTIHVRGLTVAGAKDYPLNDADVGYAWCETFAELDSSGNKIDESAASPLSARVPIQGARAKVITINTAADASYTNRIIYRQGGYLRDFYAVATTSLAASGGGLGFATGLHYDGMSDVEALTLGFRLNRGLYTRANFPNNILNASESHYDRLFVGEQNILHWSLPGKPGAFPALSQATVSHLGDQIKRLIVWPPGLIIINRDSVYEMSGTLFEGPDANWVLTRTGSRHGSKAHSTAIKTPYGIPLLELDGLYMYVPGQGIDTNIPWLMDKIGDAWKGRGGADPAQLKGNRVPSLNTGALLNSCAEYWDGKLYLAMPTATNTYPDTLFIIDFEHQRVWWHQYPFSISSLMRDGATSQLLAGTSDGAVMQIDTGYIDYDTSGNATNISWNFKTRPISAPTDFICENIQVEYRGNPMVVSAELDGTTTALATTTQVSTRDWVSPAFSGQARNEVALKFTGTQSSFPSVIHQAQMDLMVEPKRVQYFKTEHQIVDEWIWDTQYVDMEILGTGTVTGVVTVDGAAVMTRTDLVGPTNGRNRFHTSYPAETYGHITQTEYTAGSGVFFKHWETKGIGRPEPNRVTNWVGDKTCQDEHEWKTFEPCIAPLNGTVTATVICDGSSIGTYTMTGNYRQSFAFALPDDTFGRSIYGIYNGSGTGHEANFKFYDERFEGVEEPDRVNNWKHGPAPLASEQYIKTWIPILNPNGTTTGTLFVDNIALTTATFTGSDRQGFNIGVDLSTSMAVQTGSIIEAYYTGSNFKHYDTQYELEPKPFGKKTWLTKYEKRGGATQLDMARWWSYDIEPVGTATITSIWDVDGTSTHTQTITCTGRSWVDQVAFPPGVRFYNIQHRMLSSSNFRVWKDNIDIERQGIKGFSRTTVQGKPE